MCVQALYLPVVLQRFVDFLPTNLHVHNYNDVQPRGVYRPLHKASDVTRKFLILMLN